MSFPRIAWIRNKQMYRQSEKNSKNRLGICSLGGDVSKIETLDFCFAVMRYITVSFRIHHPPPRPPTIARLRCWPARQLSSVINQGVSATQRICVWDWAANCLLRLRLSLRVENCFLWRIPGLILQLVKSKDATVSQKSGDYPIDANMHCYCQDGLNPPSHWSTVKSNRKQ